jgi:hypothetical protein
MNDNKSNHICKIEYLIPIVGILLCFSVYYLNYEKKDNTRHIDMQTLYGPRFDIARQIVGLEKLGTEMKPYIYLQNRIFEPKQIDWAFNLCQSLDEFKQSCFFGKTTIFFFDFIVSESDYYTSANYYNSYGYSGDEKKADILMYRYNFLPFKQQHIGWNYFIETDRESSLRGYINKYKADSILYSWGLKRYIHN